MTILRIAMTIRLEPLFLVLRLTIFLYTFLPEAPEELLSTIVSLLDMMTVLAIFAVP